ncbi:hypothetical protein D3C80_1666070 [compost metagenome]
MPERVQHMVAPGDHPHMEVVALQIAGDQFRQGAVVFYQKNVWHRAWYELREANTGM